MEFQPINVEEAQEGDDIYVGVHHVVFRRQWSDISGVVKLLSQKCERFLACEHTPDMGCNVPHVHCLLDRFETNNKIPVEGIRGAIPAEYKKRGQYVIMEKTQVAPRKYYKVKPLAVYIVKGDEEVVRYVKLFSPVELKEFAEQWINHSEQKTDASDNKTKTHWDIIQEIVKEIEPESHSRQVGNTLLTCKRVTFDEIWHKTLKKLNEHKIKTHVKEIERFVVSVMRVTQCDDMRERLKEQVHKNIFH